MAQPPRRPPERLFDRLSQLVGLSSAERWWDLSQEVERAALGSDPSEPVDSLEEAAAAEHESPLEPAFRLWAADALARAGRDGEAVGAYDQAVSEAEAAPSLEGIDLQTEALRHRAAALARGGDVEGTIRAFRDLAARGDEWALLEAGLVARGAGRLEEAAELWQEISDQERTPDADDPKQRALREIQRLQEEDAVFNPSVLGIVQQVERALQARDGERLQGLASRTHFQVGPGGGHFRFEDSEILDWLSADLSRSRPRRLSQRLEGKGGKRYLFTTGWRGRRFRGIVGFCFTRSARGWEWSGLVPSGPIDLWKERWAPGERETNQPLPFPLLAPWQEGRYFMAGGLVDFGLKSAAVVAAGFFGGALAYYFSRSNCGYGLRGFYYNEGRTHSGANAFAIDFTSYRRGVPFRNIAGGVPVLSAADGIVRMTRDSVPSGDDSMGPNEVQINHDDPSTGATARYVSRYLHMAGPSLIPVSAGMSAPTGRRLGVMNDTGTSVLDHLHFSIHDSTMGTGIGPSVRPSPMEGRQLGDGDSGTCLRSSNTPTIVITVPPGCVEALREIIRGAFGG